LRKRWREAHPFETAEALRTLAGRCQTLGMRFGVGLSPFELYRDFNSAAQADLKRKLDEFDSWGVEDLAILFDDMRGDLPNLARTQADILHWVRDRTHATRLIMCPSYYTDDPVLDRLFGKRPANYLEDLGRFLDRSVEVFWTGEEVCSKEYSPGHLARVAAQLGRKPFLWDNYPVNDGQRMSQFLHLRAFTGRPASLAPQLSAHAVNPALQPTLSCIPAISLSESYAKGDAYEYGRAFADAAGAIMDETLATMIREDILLLQDIGLPRLGEKTKDRLRQRYGAVDHNAAREILAWLDGVYVFAEEIA
jgi:hypothetical protein